MSIAFIHPHILWALLGLLPFAALLFYFEKIRCVRLKILGLDESKTAGQHSVRSRSSKVKDPRTFGERPTRFRKWIKVLTPCLLFGLIIISLARPYNGTEEVKISGSGSDLMLVVDISRSMLATDINPSRLEFTKRKLEDLTRYLNRKAAGDRIGIVLFADESYLYCPLTQDYGVLEYFIKAISTELISSQGSVIADAVDTAIKSLEEVKSKDARILLISDGEDSQLSADAVIKSAKDHLLNIDVLAVGTTEGAAIDLGNRTFIRDQKGQIVISKMNEEVLKEIALQTGGFYEKAVFSDSDFEKLLSNHKDTLNILKKDKKSTITVYKELGPYIVIAAFCFLLLFYLSGFGPYLLILIVCLFTNPDLGRTQSPALTENRDLTKPDLLNLHEAYLSYQNSDYEKAVAAFAQAYKQNPDDMDILQAYASSLYKSGKFEDAKKLFTDLKQKSKAANKQFDADYNLGNTNFKLEDYKTAVQNYEEALKRKPEDQNTKANLELARKKLLEEQSKITPTPTPAPTPQSQSSTSSVSSSYDSVNSSSSSAGSNQSSNSSFQSDGNKSLGSSDSKDNQEGENESSSDENQSEGSSQPVSQQTHSQQKQEMDENALKESEAKAWLESLSDAPIILRRKAAQKPNRNAQSW